jgi:hypothetical protein
LKRISGIGSVADGSRRAADRLLWPRFGWAVVDRHDSAVFGCAGSAPAAAGVLADRVGER